MELGQGTIAEKKLYSSETEAKYNKKRLALGRIISSAQKTSMIEVLHAKKGLHATDLFRDAGISSEGTFFYHLRDLEWLGVIEQHDKTYTLTGFGEEMADSLSRLP